MEPSVQITFECLPLRSINRWDIPLDAPAALESLCRKVGRAAEKHGRHNSYYLTKGQCAFCFTNDPAVGQLWFGFEGTVLTDPSDRQTASADLEVELQAETCDWLTSAALSWMRETVVRAVTVEFDRFLRAGGLEKTLERLRRFEAECHAREAYLCVGL